MFVTRLPALSYCNFAKALKAQQTRETAAAKAVLVLLALSLHLPLLLPTITITRRSHAVLTHHFLRTNRSSRQCPVRSYDGQRQTQRRAYRERSRCACADMMRPHLLVVDVGLVIGDVGEKCLIVHDKLALDEVESVGLVVLKRARGDLGLCCAINRTSEKQR